MVHCVGQVYLPLPTSGNGAAQGVTMQGIALSDRSRVLICPALRYIPFFIHLTCICKEGWMYQSKLKKFARGSGIDARILQCLFSLFIHREIKSGENVPCLYLYVRKNKCERLWVNCKPNTFTCCFQDFGFAFPNGMASFCVRGGIQSLLERTKHWQFNTVVNDMNKLQRKIN